VNKVNPFVIGDDISLPGSWSNPYSFSEDGVHKEPPTPTLPGDTAMPISDICQLGKTSGDRTIDMCTYGDGTFVIDKPLEPRRNIEDGLWSLVAPRRGVVAQSNGRLFIAIGVVVVLFLVLSRRR